MQRRIWGRPRRRRAQWLAVAVVETVVALIGAGSVVADVWGSGAANGNPWPYDNPGRAPVLAAVGDICCQPGSPVEKEKQTDVCDTTGKATRPG